MMMSFHHLYMRVNVPRLDIEGKSVACIHYRNGATLTVPCNFLLNVPRAAANDGGPGAARQRIGKSFGPKRNGCARCVRADNRARPSRWPAPTSRQVQRERFGLASWSSAHRRWRWRVPGPRYRPLPPASAPYVAFSATKPVRAVPMVRAIGGRDPDNEVA